ncbi:unnamed protein product [Eruca vesicaria subsp. sativa]|uniref:TIR domain-containing protein n=1 Tax=Eruca vesicaria subsp. sativa TaxID=29727 RepID=A0ABC8JIP7_ERUVS|nr:unnamed protein product [Eruca vesicaria subsp. sativa]
MAILSRPVHQMFINFRGKDLRYGFVSHLIDALERHNIKFFIDTHEQKGRDLKHLFKRIQEATVALVILSTRQCSPSNNFSLYGESRWCLEELRTIMEQAEREELVVIPIFYKVRPEEVRKQKGEFGNKFWRLTEEYSCEEIEKWQVSLKAVSNKIGLTLEHNRSEAKFIKKVVKEVEKVLTANQFDDGREKNHVKKVTTYNSQLALPRALFGIVGCLIVAILLLFGLLPNTVLKCASLVIVAHLRQAGSVMVSSSCGWADRSIGT